MSNATVAVIGAGPSGLSMLKQLRDDGFKVTGFERRGRVGGLWAYSDDTTHTTALPRTLSNLSKFTCGFSDYPMPEKYPVFLTSAQFQEYMESYARHFDTLKHWAFHTTVISASRNADAAAWHLTVRTAEDDGPRTRTLEFDKVVFCHGDQTRANAPRFPGQEDFAGILMHSQQYRTPRPLAGMRVLVLGFSSTAGDILADVLPHAQGPVYVAHRRGAFPFARFRGGVPADALVTWRRRQLTHFVSRYLPGPARVLADAAANLLVRQSYPGLRREWRMTPAPSVALKAPGSLPFDSILPALEEGSLESVHGVKRFVGAKGVELLDGRVLEDIDAIILCTGYTGDFGVVGEDVVATSEPRAHGYGGEPMRRLWMNIFPPRYADSMAILCYSALGRSNGFSFADVTSMAVSNVFRGVHPLPTADEMELWIDRHQAWVASRWKLDRTVDPSLVKQWEFQGWLHEAAGTGMENLSWFGWKGWKFWWKDRRMYNIMSHGVETAHLYRYFETGKRKTWEGARDAILRMDAEVKRVLPVSKEQEKEFTRIVTQGK